MDICWPWQRYGLELSALSSECFEFRKCSYADELQKLANITLCRYKCIEIFITTL